MNFLTTEQRSKALERLRNAPDDVLISALVELRKIEHFEDGMKKNVEALFGEPVPRSHVNEVTFDASPAPVELTPKERSNVSPGVPLISKMGNATRDDLLTTLRAGGTIPHKFTEHLKLLWSRGEVKFDGQAFYL